MTWGSKEAVGGESAHWHSLVYGNGRWLALGDRVRKVSDNGLDWHDIASFDDGLFASVAFGKGQFVAVGKVAIVTADGGAGAAGWVATSVDGVTWAQTATITTRYDTGLESIAYVDGQFVAAGWRTEAAIYVPDAGEFVSTFTGRRPNKYDDGGVLEPWFIGFGAGKL